MQRNQTEQKTSEKVMANAAAPKLAVSFGGFSTAGKKAQNQDAFAAKMPVNDQALSYKGAVACIADGVSCSENAQQASQTSVVQFVEDYYSTPDSWKVKKSVGRVINALNAWLFHHGQNATTHNGLVTTFSGVVFKSQTAYIIHAGDSRVYRYRDGELIQLTRDHSSAQFAGNPVLTRALGMDSRLDVDYQQKKLRKGDIYLFSTDGVHEWLNNKELVDLINACDNLEAVAKNIVDAALNRDSDDNVSCLLARIDTLPQSDMEEVHRELDQLVIPPVLDVGNKIDRYKVLRVIHSGARSHLYLVEDQFSKREYVLKAPSENFSEDRQFLESFAREHWVGQRLDHPQIMKVYERQHSSNFLYHLCQPIEGKTLRQWMHDNPAPSVDQVRIIIDSVIRAMRVFQRKGMVHRDLKPENIMLTEQNIAIIIDFGTVQVDSLDELGAHDTEEVPVGSVNYIAPEYLQHNRASALSDLFSLAVITYEMLTGRLPYKPLNYDVQNPSRYTQWDYRSACDCREDIPRWLDLALKKGCSPTVEGRHHALSEFYLDISKPNEKLMTSHHNEPLMQKNPILFWKTLSFILLVICLIEAGFLALN